MNLIKKIKDYQVFGFLLILVVSLFFPLLPMAPSLEGDSLEIVAGVHTFGVLHSPGFPVYMVLIHLFSGIFYWWDLPFSLALFSAVCAGFTAGFSYLILRHYKVSQIVSLSFSLLPIFSYELWYQSLIVEVYSFALLWIVLIIWAGLRFRDSQSTLFLGFLSFLLFSGLGAHLYVWPFSFIGLVFLFFWAIKKRRPVKNFAIPTLFGSLLGLLFFVQLPVAAGRSFYINEGNINSFSRFFDHVTWKLHRERLSHYQSQASQNWGEFFNVKWQQGVELAGEMGNQLLLPLSALIFILLISGITFLVFNKKNIKRFKVEIVFGFISFILFANICILFAGSQFNFSVMDEMKVHLVPVYLFISLFIGLVCNHWTKLRNLISLSVLLLLSIHIGYFYSYMDLSKNQLALNHGKDLLRSLPENTILFASGDVDLMSIAYQQSVLGFRKDIQMINLVNGSEWYFENLLKFSGKVQWPQTYSKYFQIQVLEKNLNLVPIYFSNYQAALMILNFPALKGRFIVIPENGAYRLAKSHLSANLKSYEFSNSNLSNQAKRGSEQDIFGQYMDYYLKRALHLKQKSPEIALSEIQQGLELPVVGSKFNQIMRNELIKAHQLLIVGKDGS